MMVMVRRADSNAADRKRPLVKPRESKCYKLVRFMASICPVL